MRSFSLALIIISILALACTATQSQAAEAVGLTFDLTAAGKTITNKFSDINMWSISSGGVWTKSAANWPKDYFSKNYHFVQRIQLMSVTGGNAQRDLFVDADDRSTLTDYHFDNLIMACRNIVAMGLKPMIKTGWVPIKMSSQPELKSFRTNIRPPDDYDAYYDYIKAIAEALVQNFGLAEVRTWTWCVGVEYDNRSWFEAVDGEAETTRAAFFRLYDYSVAALEDVLGPEKLIVGAHGMAAGGWGLWDMADLIQHCAQGHNARRATIGTQLDFLNFSYYSETPGFKPDKFVADIDRLRSKAKEFGMPKLRFGIDEGRVLNGWDKKVVYAREVQHPIQAAGDAKLFHLMVDRDVDYFSTWHLTTQGISDALPLVSTNLRNLVFRMTGSALVEASRSGEPGDTTNDVGGLAGYDAATRTLRVLVYNFNRNKDAAVSEDVSITLTGFRADSDDNLAMRCWLLDEDHGNWWKAWQADMKARNMNAEDFRHSKWTLILPGELKDADDIAFWKSRVPDYAKAARMTPTNQTLSCDHKGRVQWQTKLKANAVTLYEISPIDPAPPVPPATPATPAPPATPATPTPSTTPE